MLATSLTAAVVGVDAHLVRVETDTASGFPKFTMVGLPDSAVKESERPDPGGPAQLRLRVQVGPADHGEPRPGQPPQGRLVLRPRHGGRPAVRRWRRARAAASRLRSCSSGELALDGSLRTVPGVLPMVLMARRLGPAGRVRPARQRARSRARAAASTSTPSPPCPRRSTSSRAPRPTGAGRAARPSSLRARRPLPAPIWRTSAARRWLAGPSRSRPRAGTTSFSSGPPGSGKTMLARRLAGNPAAPGARRGPRRPRRSIPPPASSARPLVTPSLPEPAPHLERRRPSWGAAPIPRPGEVSLAHNGVLFLDELPEFRRSVLESLRQPLEEGCDHDLAGAGVSLRLPARFQLVARHEPLPLRGLGPAGCSCTPRQATTYSEPPLGAPARPDRPPRRGARPSRWSEMAGPPGESSAGGVADASGGPRPARTAGAGSPERPAGGREPAAGLRPRHGGTSPAGPRRSSNLGLSARAHDRVLRVARTIADLDGQPSDRGVDHVAEALQFRRCERRYETVRSSSNCWRIS